MPTDKSASGFKRTIIWHLSDLHIDNPVKLAPPTSLSALQISLDGQRLDPRIWLLNAIDRSIYTNKTAFLENAAPHFIVITGDLVDSHGEKRTSLAKRLKFAKAYIKRLIAALSNSGRPPEPIICPGNHDLKRPTSESQDTYTYRFRAFNEVFSEFPYRPAKSGLAKSAAFPEHGVHFFIFNSAGELGGRKKWNEIAKARTQLRTSSASYGDVLNAIKTLASYDAGYITPRDFTYLDKQIIRKRNTNGLLRIALTHHSPPGLSLEPEVAPHAFIVNFGQFHKWMLSQKVFLLLHGHKHEYSHHHISSVEQSTRKDYELSLSQVNGVYCIGTTRFTDSPLRQFGLNILHVQEGYIEPKVEVYHILSLDQPLYTLSEFLPLHSDDRLRFLSVFPRSVRVDVSRLFNGLQKMAEPSSVTRKLIQSNGILASCIKTWSSVICEFSKIEQIPPGEGGAINTYLSEQFMAFNEWKSSYIKALSSEMQSADATTLDSNRVIRITTHPRLQDIDREDRYRTELLSGFASLARKRGFKKVSIQDLIIVPKDEEDYEDQVRAIDEDPARKPFERKVILLDRAEIAEFHLYGKQRLVMINNLADVIKQDASFHVLRTGDEKTIEWFIERFHLWWERAVAVGTCLNGNGK